MQVLPFVHCVPQAPQFASSLFASTQEPLQFVRPGAQPSAHAPWLQTPCVPVQALPQAPQFFGSFARFVHSAPQRASFVPHEHAPWAQVSLAPQAVVHEPQCCSSLPTSMHD
jgi:hypothetical protein